MRMELTADQCAQLTPHLRPDAVLLGRVERESFNGTNADVSGRLLIVFTSIPADRLDAVRLAIDGELAPAPKRKAKT